MKSVRVVGVCLLLIWYQEVSFQSLADAAGVNAEAYIGQPFGVAKIDLGITPEILPSPLGVEGILIKEASGRVHYPVIATSAVGGFFAELVGSQPRATFYFLFRGDTPLEIELLARTPIRVVLAPQSNARRFNRLLTAWWREYAQPPGLFEAKPDYPPLVTQYLRLMLAQRLGLRLPQSSSESWEAWFREQLGLTLSSEPIRLKMLETRFLAPEVLTGPANQSLPSPWDNGPAPTFEAPPEVAVEEIAAHVPEECLYLRFGNFRNFLWLQDTLARWGGDIQNLVALRSLNYEMSRRLEEQLVLRQSALSRLFGETVVADIAIIGYDLHFHEGASFGLLFQAKNNLLFQTNLLQQRKERLAQGDVREEKLTILNRPVSYLISSDGRVRSYYVADGNFHLVATSRRLVERFLEAGRGEKSLSQSAEFRFARSLFPLDRPDTAFVYLSRIFFQNLTSPAYRIETQRRMQALTDLDLVELALLAAASEGVEAESIEDLVARGYLPKGFGPRSDGSFPILEQGTVRDSLRGFRGGFVPIADVPITRISLAEATMYQEFLAYYAQHWRRLDPMLVAIQRNSEGPNRERIIIDARVTPLAKENYERLLGKLGPPDRQQLAPIPGDLGRFEIILNRGRLFGGLYDLVPPIDIINGRIVPTGRIRDILIGYLGTTGELGWLGKINRTFSTRPDANGYSRGLFGLWRREMPGMTVFSFQPEVLAAVTDQLHWVESPDEAHIRINFGDLSRARITPLLNRFVYWRTQQTSLGNIRFLRDLEQQLHVPGEECKTVAEILFNARLECPLGGEYVFQPDENGIPRWTSTAFLPVVSPTNPSSVLPFLPFGYPLSPAIPERLRAMMPQSADPIAERERALDRGHTLGEVLPPGVLQNNTTAHDSTKPQEFLAPPLNWFRGLSATALVNCEAVTAHLEIIMEWPSQR
ncbi:MAG: hypothetical protein ACUVQR_04540 [Thermogutta sp.]